VEDPPGLGTYATHPCPDKSAKFCILALTLPNADPLSKFYYW